MSKNLTQEEKDKRTVIGLILAIIFIIIIIILVSYSYSGKDETKDKRFEDPTIIQKEVGEDIETINYIPNNNVVFLNNTVNTVKKEEKVQTNLNELVLKKEAEKLILIALDSYLEDDLTNATNAINKIQDEKIKQALNTKLENVKKYIEIDKELNKYNSIINSASSKEEIDNIRLEYKDLENKFDSLINNNKKDELQTKIDLLLSIINDEESPIINLPTSENNYYNENIILNIEDTNEFSAILTNLITNEEKEVKNNEEINMEGKYTLTVTDKAQNVTTVEFVIDKQAPVINPECNASVELFVGDQYIEEGLSILDNIDGISTTTTVNKIINNATGLEVDNVDTSSVGSYTIYYEAKDIAGNTVLLEKLVNVVENPNVILENKSKVQMSKKVSLNQEVEENTLVIVDEEKQVQEEPVQIEEIVEE